MAAHLSDYGSAALFYQYQNPGHLLAFTEIINVRPSVIFTEPFAGIDEGDSGAQTLEAVWWRHTPKVHGFVSISNVTKDPITVSLQPTGSLGTRLASSALTLQGHSTQMLDLDVALWGLPQAENQGGGLRVEYTGRKRAIMASGGLLDEGTGYSADIPFWSHDADPSSAPVAINYASVGIMVGKPHPGMGFPPALRFTPYTVLRNTTAQPLAVTVGLNYMAGGSVASSPVSLALPAQQLMPLETRRLDLASMLADLGLGTFDGDVNLTFALTGRGGDLLVATGSVDQTGNFVFPVLPEAIGKSFGKGISHWTVANGLDTMYSLWNPTDSAQDFTMTLHYGDGSGQFVKAIHLEPRASLTVDIGMLITEHEPDANGNAIPIYVQEGSVTFSNPKGRTEWMTLAVCGAFYNPRKGTCGNYWTYCYGWSGQQVYANPFSVSIDDTTQLAAYATYADGSQYRVGATWGSSNTSVATVDSNGVVTPVAAGSVQIVAYYDALVVYTGELCSYGNPVPCPTGYLQAASSGTVGDATPVIYSISPSAWVSGETIYNGTISGEYFGTAPTVQLSDPTINFSYTPVSDGQINFSGLIPPTTPSEGITVTVTSNGYNGSGFIPVQQGESASGSNNSVSNCAPNPRIYFGGGDITNTTQSVVAGQQIALSAAYNTCGLGVVSQSWSAGSGTVVGGYNPSTGPTSVTDANLNQQSPTFYWAYPGNFQVTFTVNLGNVSSPTAQATFNVTGPTGGSMGSAAYNLVTIASLSADAGPPPCSAGPYLVYASAAGSCFRPIVAPAGIEFNTPTGYSNTSGGQFYLAQLVNSDVLTGSSPKTYSGGLDTEFPYGFSINGGHPPSNDNPSVYLDPSWATESRTFNATIFLLWKSDAPSSIYVPLGYQTWGFSGTGNCSSNCTSASNWNAVTNQPTGTVGNFTPSSSTQAHDGFPTWNGTNH